MPAALWALAAATPAFGQQDVREIVLERPQATFPEPFSLVQTVRELGDGRVLVADPLEQALLRVDLVAGRAERLGRVGQGPDEYRQPDAVHPLPGDSTLLVDLGNGRLVAVGPEGEFGPTWPLAEGSPGPGGRLTLRVPRGTDARGRIYFQASPFGGRPGEPPARTAPLLRWDRARAGMDTLTTLTLPELAVSSSGGADDRRVAVRQVPLSPADGWAVAPDGRVGVARAADYRVEWISPDGGVVRGEPVPNRPVRIRQAEREEWAESRRLQGGVAVSVSMENGRATTSFARSAGRGQEDDLDAYAWPDSKPPFVASEVWATPEGELWVRRSRPAGEPAAFDAFGPDTKLRSRVTLPAGRRLVGFGEGVLYAVHADEFDLLTRERYGRP